MIATSAAITPFSIIDTSGFFRTTHAVRMPLRPPGRRSEVRGQGHVGEVADTAEVDRQGRAGVEPEPPEPEDDRPEHGVRDVVAGNRVRAAVGPELADARPEQQRAGEGRESALVVHDRRAGEVLHALGEQPAVRAPDPVGRDRVDEREVDAEDEVDVELRPLRHRPPDDRQRDAGEHDLEQVPRGTRDLAEPVERLLCADRDQLGSPTGRTRRCR